MRSIRQYDHSTWHGNQQQKNLALLHKLKTRPTEKKRTPIPSTEKEEDKRKSSYFTGSLRIFESAQNTFNY